MRVTLDPTERHGFEYQSWIGFSIFAEGIRGEVGRGGSYTVGGGEAAVGFSLYVDGLVDAGLGIVARRRLWLPRDTAPATGARLRSEGWATVAALSDEAPTGCTHRWNGVEAVPINAQEA